MQQNRSVRFVHMQKDGPAPQQVLPRQQHQEARLADAGVPEIRTRGLLL